MRVSTPRGRGSGRPGSANRTKTVPRKVPFAVLLLMVGAAPGGAAGDGAGLASWQNDLRPIGAGDWDHQKAAHLLERARFGATPAEVEHLAGMTPAAAVHWLWSTTSSTLTGWSRSMPRPSGIRRCSSTWTTARASRTTRTRTSGASLQPRGGQPHRAGHSRKGRARSPAGPTTSWSSSSTPGSTTSGRRRSLGRPDRSTAATSSGSCECTFSGGAK